MPLPKRQSNIWTRKYCTDDRTWACGGHVTNGGEVEGYITRNILQRSQISGGLTHFRDFCMGNPKIKPTLWLSESMFRRITAAVGFHKQIDLAKIAAL
jgi:hypothetical protein